LTIAQIGRKLRDNKVNRQGGYPRMTGMFQTVGNRS
jgi:hypothetical protein